MKKYHSLERSNAFRQPFRGTCIRCGKEELPLSAALEECLSDDELSPDDLLIRAIRGPTPSGD